MGNQNSHSTNGHHNGHRHSRSTHRQNPAATKTFNDISEGRGELKRSDFERVFGHKIGGLLWTAFFNDKDHVGEEAFAEHYYDLTDMRSDQCIKMFPSVEGFLDACLSTAGKSIENEDSDYVSTLMGDIDKEGGMNFFTSHCPGLAQNTVIRQVRNVICPTSEQVIFTFDSAICSPLQMLLIQGSLPEMVYFQNKQASHPCWNKLYDSNAHGLSANRFEGKVFGYNSPTVAIFKLQDAQIFAIATNVEWRNTTKYLGTTLTRCLKLAPHFKYIESRHQEPVFCNFKYRSADSGIGFRDVFKVNGDFDNVQAIEVWGCGNSAHLDEQQKQKMRDRMHAERRQKVPMPGEWDQNPDKHILEMAGYQFSDERNKPQPPHEND